MFAQCKSSACRMRSLAGLKRRQFSNSTFRERVLIRYKGWKRNGTLEISLGSFIFGVIGIDHLLQYQQQKARDQMMDSLQFEIDRDMASGPVWDAEQLQKTALFVCKVKQLPQLFDGSKSLTNVRLGDIVEVIEEGIGPDGTYNLCRARPASTKEDPSFGWFPMSCLEKIDS